MGRITFGVDKIGKTATDEMWNKTLIKLSGDEWKEVRSMFSPCFTSGRMKMMTKFMKVDRCAFMALGIRCKMLSRHRNQGNLTTDGR